MTDSRAFPSGEVYFIFQAPARSSAWGSLAWPLTGTSPSTQAASKKDKNPQNWRVDRLRIADSPS